jgi:hypothetical protein
LEIWDWRPRGIMAITDAWRNIPPHGEMLPIVGIQPVHYVARRGHVAVPQFPLRVLTLSHLEGAAQ